MSEHIDDLEAKKASGLQLLRTPFPPNQIGKLAKGSKAQMTCQASEKVNCNVCGGWHHPKLIHLDYVGHAALTDRLLDADPEWSWEPLALKDGLPAFDETGGLWIKLTVRGITRLGYGNAAESEYKDIGSRQKECIGDALRNAAMRFGAALELWHKGDLHAEPETVVAPTITAPGTVSGAVLIPKESTGRIVEQEVALENFAPEAREAIRKEAKKIEVDFYTISAKAALGSWNAFKKVSGQDEQEACWSLMDSKVRSGIKKYGTAQVETA